MGALSNILNRLWLTFAKVPIPGTITAVGGDKALYPTAVMNEIAGGHHSYDSLEDLASIPVSRLVVGMTATVRQHERPDGEIVKRTKYVLEILPTDPVDRISEISNYDISLYWKVDDDEPEFEGALETQYAPNCDKLTGIPVTSGGTTPPYPGMIKGLKITYDQYAELVVGNDVVVDGVTIAGYWADTYEPHHVWMRERTGINGKWSRPYKVNGEGYSEGDYIENRFKWSLTIPPTPPQYINGLPNNLPEGWEDVPPANPGNGSRLWMIRGEKDKYQRLESPWLPPIEIKIDPLLVRYSEKPTPNPNDIPYNDLTANGWESMLDSSRHRFMATRQEVSSGIYSEWIIVKIAQESGEFTSYVFKKFKNSLTNDILINPELYRPVGVTPAGWEDTPSQSIGEDETWFVSIARKFFDGELIDDWSDPIPFTGRDVVIGTISTDGGDEFKKDKQGVITPEQLSLKATLYKGVTVVTPSSITWTRIFNGGDLDETSFGNTAEITIHHSEVVGLAVFKVVQVFDGTEYVSEISIVDIADGIDAKSLRLSSTRDTFIRKVDGSFSPASITLHARSANLSDEGLFTWFKDGVQVVDSNGLPYRADSLVVDYADFATDKEITYKVSSIDGLIDEFTIVELAEATGGAPAITMVLSNESHIIVEDEATKVLDLDGAFTFVKVYEGANDVTGLWTVSKIDSGVTSTLDVTDVAKPKVSITGFVGTGKAGHVTIKAVKDTNSVSKQFSITKIVDPVGAIILDIDSSNAGYVFSPVNTANKTLSAKLYVDGTVVTTNIEYKWFFDNETVPRGTSNTQLVRHSDVNFMTTIRCEATYKQKTYTRVVNITDVKDAKGIGILYSTSVATLTDSDRPQDSVLYNAAAGTSSSGTTSWTNSSANAVWMSIRREGETRWSTPARIRGEKGEQGTVGNTIRNIFRASDTLPATPIGNWIPTGWFDTPPTGNTIWISYGEIDKDGKLVGAWTTPKQVNGKDGGSGPAGPPGPPGPKGEDGANGVFSPDDFWDGPAVTIQGSNGIPNYESWSFNFRKTKAGIVYYMGRSYRGGSGERTVDFNLPVEFATMKPYAGPAGADNKVLAALGVTHTKSPTEQGNSPAYAPLIFDDFGVLKLKVRYTNGWTSVSHGCYLAVGTL